MATTTSEAGSDYYNNLSWFFVMHPVQSRRLTSVSGVTPGSVIPAIVKKTIEKVGFKSQFNWTTHRERKRRPVAQLPS